MRALLRPLVFVAALIAVGCGGNPLVPKVEEAPADAGKTGQANLLLFPIEDAEALLGRAVQLSDTKASDVLAILDSCFSGAGGRSVLPPGARPLVRVKETTVPAAGSRLAVLSASGGGEISGPASNGVGGLFTKHVADGLSGQADADCDGKLSLKELFDFVKPRVAKEARRDNREQTPQLTTGHGVGDGGGFVVASFKGKK